MISVNAGFLYLAAFLHVVTAPLSLMLSSRSTKHEDRWLAALKMATALYCLLGGLLADATSAAAGEPFLRLQLIVGHVVMLLLIQFALAVMEVPWGAWARMFLVAALLAMAAIATGLFADPGAVDLANVTWAGGPMRRAPPEGLLLLISAAGIFSLLVAVWRLLRDQQAVSTIFAVALLLMASGWSFDLVARGSGWPVLLLSEHAVSLAVFIVGYVFFRRFVHQTDELRVRTSQLAQQNEQLAALQEQLVRREQLATVGELSAVIAQEVRSPLTAIRHAVEELRAPKVTAPDRALLLDSLDEENDRMNRLVRDLLVYASPSQPHFEVVPLQDVMNEALQKFDNVENLDVVIDLEGAPQLIDCDPKLLATAFGQIARNAVDAMPAGGELTVRAEVARSGDEPALAIRFSDTGEGMDTRVRSRARDPFFTTRSSATGLGLAIVERLVAVHGGQLEISTADNRRGTTVTVLLPAKPAPRGEKHSSHPPERR